MSSEILLVGWDGATFSLLNPLMDKGVMPHLRDALARGVSADLLSTVPPLTPPAWTSIVTGHNPGHHGVFDFFQKESADSLHLRLALSSNIRKDTLWSLANRGGKRTTVLNYPVMFPPPPVQGYLISGGWLTWRQFRLACHPSGLFETIQNLEGMDLKTLAMDMSHEEKAVEGCSPEETLLFVEKHIQREQHWFKILSHLLEKDPTEVVSIVFDGMDKIQHLCWPLLASWARDPGDTGGEDKILDACLEYYREVDRTLGWILERMGPESHLLLVSDHGFGESEDLFFVNQWLSDKGYLSWKDAGASRATADKSLGLAQISRHVFEMDWESTQAFSATPSSNGIHILPGKNAGLERSDDPSRKALEDALIADLLAIRSPTTGQPMISRVWKREEAFPGPHGHLAPDLTLSLWDGGLVSILASDAAVQKRSQPVGAHRPQGIFCGVGPAFSGGKQIQPLSLLDVTPAILHLLGLPIPDDLEGRVPLECFHPEFQKTAQREKPVGPELDEQALQDPGAETLMTEDDERVIAQRLRELGYLE